MSVDLSFMDLLFDKEDPVIGFDKDMKTEDLKPFFMDDKTLNNDDWACNADSFLDSIFQMDNENQPFELLQNQPFDLLDKPVGDDAFSNFESSSCSDSGLSSDHQMSPPSIVDDIEIEDEVEIKEEIIELDSTDYDDLPSLKSEPEEAEEEPEVNVIDDVIETAEPEVEVLPTVDSAANVCPATTRCRLRRLSMIFEIEDEVEIKEEIIELDSTDYDDLPC
ncbi:hypothetical protein LSTR_LSTR008224 [Laodelphax striatellus]|uniref:Uncharacterized protein n=1 Tax=Laodelphax striatellus TaxID=195883 RepID=A0A482WVF8_LAOST|nr:hypothetical protein LSTR_LSTR008224 [Laodelphax striatellus]